MMCGTSSFVATVISDVRTRRMQSLLNACLVLAFPGTLWKFCPSMMCNAPTVQSLPVALWWKIAWRNLHD
eukprot:14592204-Heterocapsa_arctica.AAC.1